MAEPEDQAPRVPHSLGGGVQRVHHVAREDAVTAHRPDAARAVDRQDRAEEVEPELAVQVVRPEETEIRAGGAHPDSMHAHEPRARLSLVPQDPGVRRAVPLVGEPAIPARLPCPRLIGTLEGEVLEAVLGVAAAPTAQLLDWRRGPVVDGGLFEPASLLEQGESLLQLPANARRPPADRERPGSEDYGAHRELILRSPDRHTGTHTRLGHPLRNQP